MGNPNCAKEVAVDDRDAGVGPPPDLDAGVPNAAAVGQSAEINAADAGVAGCVAAQGGSTRYRPGGIASVAELEAYGEARARREQTAAGDVLYGMATLEDGVHLAVDVVRSGAKAAVSVGRGVKRIGETAWAGLTADDAALMQIGSENLELYEFVVEMLSRGTDLGAWFLEPSGPLTQMMMAWTGAYLDVALEQRDVEHIVHVAKLRAVQSAADAAKSLAIGALVVSPALRRVIHAALTAIATASLSGGLNALTQGVGDLKHPLTFLIIQLKIVGLLDTISGPRRRLESMHPEIFAVAEAHKCAFMWTWVEPELPALAGAIEQHLDRLEAEDA